MRKKPFLFTGIFFFFFLNEDGRECLGAGSVSSTQLTSPQQRIHGARGTEDILRTHSCQNTQTQFAHSRGLQYFSWCPPLLGKCVSGGTVIFYAYCLFNIRWMEL